MSLQTAVHTRGGAAQTVEGCRRTDTHTHALELGPTALTMDTCLMPLVRSVYSQSAHIQCDRTYVCVEWTIRNSAPEPREERKKEDNHTHATDTTRARVSRGLTRSEVRRGGASLHVKPLGSTSGRTPTPLARLHDCAARAAGCGGCCSSCCAPQPQPQRAA